MRLGLKAQFLGTDGSLGYQKGLIYDLRVFDSTPGMFLTVERMDGSGRCPYESPRSFLRNWHPVEETHPEGYHGMPLMHPAMMEAARDIQPKDGGDHA